jgi:hypothetical protein
MDIDEQVDGYLRRTESVVPNVSNNNSNNQYISLR